MMARWRTALLNRLSGFLGMGLARMWRYLLICLSVKELAERIKAGASALEIQQRVSFIRGIIDLSVIGNQCSPLTVGPLTTEPSKARSVCRNNQADKQKEVRASLAVIPEGTPLRDQLEDLYRRGAFRHDHDVAFATIALCRGFHTVDSLVEYLSLDYRTIDHRCDPVYPPS